MTKTRPAPRDGRSDEPEAEPPASGEIREITEGVCRLLSSPLGRGAGEAGPT